MLLQDAISSSKKPHNRKKVGFLVLGLAKEKSPGWAAKRQGVFPLRVSSNGVIHSVQDPAKSALVTQNIARFPSNKQATIDFF